MKLYLFAILKKLGNEDIVNLTLLVNFLRKMLGCKRIKIIA